MKKILTTICIMSLFLNNVCWAALGSKKDSGVVNRGNYSYYQNSNTQVQDNTNFFVPANYIPSYEQNNNIYQEPDIINKQDSNTYYDNYFQPTLSGSIIKTGRGKKLNIFLQDSIDTKTMQIGDEIIAVLNDDWYYNGNPIAEAGSVVYGKFESANSAGYMRKNAKFQINFYKIATPNGNVFNIAAEKIDFEITPDSEEKTRILANAVKYVAIGALVGLLLFSGSSSSYSFSDRHYGRGAAIGAGIAAAGTAITTLSVKGEDAVVPANTLLELTLTDDVTVTVD